MMFRFRPFSVVCIGFAALIAFSCASGGDGIPVPGETRLRDRNIATEYYTIAEAYADLKKYDKAAAYYKRAMREPELRAAAYYKLGRAYALSGNWDEAEKIFRTLLKRDPANTTLSVSLAYITAMKGDTEKALAMYRDLTRKNPNEASILQNYIVLLITGGKLDAAEQQLFILKNKFPDNDSIDKLQKKIYENQPRKKAGDGQQSESSAAVSLPPPEAAAE